MHPPSITLTNDQQVALDAFVGFLCDPIETVFVLQGYSGTGKTTLVKTLIERLEGYLHTARLLQPHLPDYEVRLTATTNKAAEAFADATDHDVSTIHSLLGLRVQTDFKTGKTTLVQSAKAPQENLLLFIDEASYIDSATLGMIFAQTKNCKIVFMGDPAQLTPVKATNTPVFDANFRGAMLSEVVRQAAGNPIVDLSTKFRETVKTGKFFSFKPDGHHIQHLPRNQFEDAILEEFIRPDWQYKDSKVMAWTNKCVIQYNHAIREHVKGDPRFQAGDYAVCNKFVPANNGNGIKTDELVHINSISEDMHTYGVVGNTYNINNNLNVFMPHSLADKNVFIKTMRTEGDYHKASDAEERWIDLRAVFACTINKAQGSTFDRVFIDLDDIRRCNSGEQIARMLYVGISRARFQVYLTGDIA